MDTHRVARAIGVAVRFQRGATFFACTGSQKAHRGDTLIREYGSLNMALPVVRVGECADKATWLVMLVGAQPKILNSAKMFAKLHHAGADPQIQRTVTG